MRMMTNPNVDGVSIERPPAEEAEGAIHELEDELTALEDLLRSKNEWEEAAAKAKQEGGVMTT